MIQHRRVLAVVTLLSTLSLASWAGAQEQVRNEDHLVPEGGGGAEGGGGIVIIFPTDSTPPSAITTLDAAPAGIDSIVLSWTAPGDDAMAGTAAIYDLRYSTAPIPDDASFTSATPVAGEPAPASAWTPQSMTLSGLLPDTTYHFALLTRDESLNWSGLSNSVSARTDPISTPTPTPTSSPRPADSGGSDSSGGCAGSTQGGAVGGILALAIGALGFRRIP